MTEQGDPRERFILCVIDASFGRNAEEAREGRGEAGRQQELGRFPFFWLTRVILIIGRRRRGKGEEEAITYHRHGSGMVTNLEDWHGMRITKIYLTSSDIWRAA